MATQETPERHARAVEVARGRQLAANGVGRQVRLASRLSLREFAEAMLPHSMSPSTVARYESGERVPAPDHSVAYARLIDVLIAGRAGV